jgi:hypothetical protein
MESLSWRNDQAALFLSGRSGLAIQVEVAVKVRTGEETKIDGQPHASYRNRIRDPTQSVRGEDQVGNAMQVRAGYWAAEVSNAWWRRRQWCPTGR